MDSQEAANQAQIKAYRLALLQLIITVIPGILTLVLTFWPSLQGSGFMQSVGPILIILLSSSVAVSAISLVIVTIRRLKTKRLIAEMDALKTELGNERQSAKVVRETADRLEGENQELTKKNSGLIQELNNVTMEMNLPDQKRQQAIAKQDRENIEASVIVTGIQFRNETLHDKRRIDFIFALFNQSLYEITIDDLLGDGDIVFNGEPFVKKKEIVDNKAKNLPTRMSGHFTIRQYLDAGDIEAIKVASDDRLFGLHNLRIKIKGGTEFEQIVTEKRLQFSCSISKQYPIWLNYDGPSRSKFNGELGGHIREVYFQSRLDLLNTYVKSHDKFYDLFFVMHTYVVNHGAPTSIDNFRLVVKANGVSYEAQKQPLSGFHVIRPGVNAPLSDIEDQNDVTLTDTRRGWLRFVVRGVKRYEEDRPELTVDLNVIDKNEDSNRITPLAQSEWRGHSQDQESYISGNQEWQI